MGCIVAILDGGNCSSGKLELAILKELLTFLAILNSIVPPVARARKPPRAFGFDGSMDRRFVILLRKLNQSNGGGGGGDGGFMVCQIFSICFCAIIFHCVVYRVAGDHSPNGIEQEQEMLFNKKSSKTAIYLSRCMRFADGSGCLSGGRSNDLMWVMWMTACCNEGDE
mmetsp:Transcript_22641/g.41524  ORF Transcript_22641/g.41524 Transcript_22641/m.41524 type:complete len:168 (+) Transcript_22641:1265-1768(+)